MMMSDKIQDMIESALSSINLDGASPNEAVIKIVSECSEDATPDIIERVVQGLNTRRVVDQVKNGEDLEEGCCLASPEDIKGTVVVNELKEKKAQFTGTDEFYYEAPRDYYQEKTANLDFTLDFGEDPAKYNPSGYVWEAEKEIVTSNTEAMEKVASRERREAVQEGYDKLHSYLRKFAEYKQRDTQFVEEMRYLFPESGILKCAGLEKGAKRIPDYHTRDHEEFLQAEKILQQFKFIKRASSLDIDKMKEQDQLEQLQERAAKRAKKPAQDIQALAQKFALTGSSAMELGQIMGAPLLNPALSAYTALDLRYNPHHMMNYGLARMMKERGEGAIAARTKARMGAKKSVSNIERRALFDSLMKDPEFRGVDKGQMLKLYGDVSKIAPELSKIPAMVRSILRASNAANNYDLSPEIVNSLVRAEKAKTAKTVYL